MSRLNLNQLKDHEVDIFNICVAQGLTRSQAVFFAKVFFPIMFEKKKQGDTWNGVTLRFMADAAGVSSPAAKRHVDFLSDIDEHGVGIIHRNNYRSFDIVSDWRIVLYRWRRENLSASLSHAIFS
jgi:hypothetical protein